MGREIRVREVVKDIKSIDKAATAAQHMKAAYIRTKEYARPQSNEPQEHSPTEYAQGKIVRIADQTAHKAAGEANRQGAKVVERIRARNKTVKEVSKEGAEGVTATGVRCVSADLMHTDLPGQEARFSSSERASKVRGKASFHKEINGNGAAALSVKKEKRIAGAGIKTAHQAQRQEWEAQQAMRLSRNNTKKVYQTSVKTAREGKQMIRKTKTAASKTVNALAAAARELVSAALSGSWVVLLLLIVIILFGGVLYTVGGDNASAISSVSPEVEAYGPLIQKYAEKHGIPEYVELIKAVMMQESGGQGNDPMQASECGYNKKYSNSPNGITDPEYSIDVGIQNLAACLDDAGAKNPMDMDNIKTALQGYNYGNGYIAWAKKRDGHYTAENAAAFSEMMAKRLGWKSYGDKEYVPHVLRYYSFGRVPTGTGDQVIVEIALKQEGNVGGQPYWSWYGFNSRVAWCACFVSWCANQCGYIESGIFPKFASCMNGAAWFREHRRWKDRSYVPKAGDIIFFNWNGDQKIDHVGIVVNATKGKVNTIEGNSRNMCRRKSYDLGSSWIVGYGVPKY